SERRQQEGGRRDVLPRPVRQQQQFAVQLDARDRHDLERRLNANEKQPVGSLPPSKPPTGPAPPRRSVCALRKPSSSKRRPPEETTMFLNRLFRSAKSRPARLSVEALEDRLTPTAMLTIGNVDVLEGNDGVQNALVTVRLTEPHGNNVTVNYATVDG